MLWAASPRTELPEGNTTVGGNEETSRVVRGGVLVAIDGSNDIWKIYTHTHTYIYIYIYIERERGGRERWRERERDRKTLFQLRDTESRTKG